MKPIFFRQIDGSELGQRLAECDREMERLHKELLASCSGRNKNPERILKNIRCFLIAASTADITMRQKENLSKGIKAEAMTSEGLADRCYILIDKFERDMSWICLLAKNIRAMAEHAELSPGKKYLGIESFDEAVSYAIHGVELPLQPEKKALVEGSDFKVMDTPCGGMIHDVDHSKKIGKD